jgi:transmembrane protein EpsG
MTFIDAILKSAPSSALYLLVFFISVFLYYISNKPKYNKSILKFVIRFISMLIPSLLIGLRSHIVGADTSDVINGYLLRGSYFDFVISFDRLGYRIFEIFSYFLFGDTFQIFLILNAFITICVVMIAINNIKDEMNSSIFLLGFYLLFGVQMMNQSRQILSLSFVFLAITLYMKKHNLRSLLFILLATSLHYSAIIALIMFIFGHNKFYRKIYNILYLALFFSAFVFLPVVLPYLGFILPEYYQKYFEYIEYTGIGFGFFIILIPIAISTILFVRSDDYRNSVKLNVIAKFSIMGILFRYLGYFSYFFYRISYYPLIASLLLLSRYSKTSKRVRKLVIFVFVIFYVLFYMYSYSENTFPYSISW